MKEIFICEHFVGWQKKAFFPRYLSPLCQKEPQDHSHVTEITPQVQFHTSQTRFRMKGFERRLGLKQRHNNETQNGWLFRLR